MMLRRSPGVVVLTFALCSLCAVCGAEVRLANVFSENMVLQRDMPVPVWGWASPGEKVTVAFAAQKAECVAGDDGRWSVTLDALQASDQPAELTAQGKNTVRIGNVLVGEVWVCSGQSNMQWSVSASNDSKAEIADASNYPKIRLLTVPNITSDKPLNDITATWVVCDSRTSGGFSAVGYFFGRTLHKHLGVPVGLIDSSWGGTPAEAWTSREALDRVPYLKADAEGWDARVAAFKPEDAEKKYQSQLALWRGAVKRAERRGKQPPGKPGRPGPGSSPHRPAALYNGMIAPIVPFAMRGAIWYQGESNAGRAWRYGTLFPTMITDWRTRWGQGDFPFLFVQLANFMAVQTEPSQDSANWPFLREAQMRALELPNVGVASAIDIGDEKSIHPTNKQEVGRRLALAAGSIAHGETLVFSGPIYEAGSMEVRDGKALVGFQHVGGGLKAKGEALKGFAIAGEDKAWVWAEAKIEGDHVAVWSDAVPSPAAVRYSWANNPIGNLYNAEGLPASPFRTDNWPGNDGPHE
jgi:sialate O-acetylesterase